MVLTWERAEQWKAQIPHMMFPRIVAKYLHPVLNLNATGVGRISDVWDGCRHYDGSLPGQCGGRVG